MLKQLRQYRFFETLKHTSWYFLGNVLITLLGLASTRIYTTYMSTADYGIAEIYMGLIKVLPVVLTLNLYGAMGRYYFEGKEDWRAFFGNTLLYSGSIFLISGGLYLLAGPVIAPWINVPVAVWNWALPAAAAVVVLSIFNQLFVARRESRKVMTGQFLMSLGRFLGAWILLAWLPLAWEARVVGDALAALVIALGLFWTLKPFLQFSKDKTHLQYAKAFSVPLIPYQLSSFILTYFDQLMINALLGNAANGLYTFAYKIGFLYSNFDVSMQNAASVDFYKWMNEKNYDAIHDQIKSMLKFQTLAASFLILFGSDLGYLLAGNKSFTEGLSLVPLVVIGYVFFALYSLYGRVLFYNKSTLIVSIITLAAGTINILLNYWLLPLYGYWVAGWTTLIAYLTLWLLGMWQVALRKELFQPRLGPQALFIAYLLVGAAVTYSVQEMAPGWIMATLLKGVYFAGLAWKLFSSKIMSLIRLRIQ